MHGHIYNCGPCPYLPDREFHAFHPHPNPPGEVAYRQLLDARFRRSGSHLYMPICPSCNACQPVRVDVAAFAPRNDQRRCAVRNADLLVSWQPRGIDAERRQLYEDYQRQTHERSNTGADAAEFLVEDGGVSGGELHARDKNGQLLAVSICDLFDDALSSVYCYYARDARRRALGTFMALAEIDFCRERGLRWWYLGFLVRGCGKMEYKSRFRPQEVLERGTWVRYE
jgi:leucyl-tRNA---protein transferase